MSVKHKIRTKTGQLIEVELTPRRAIKAHCLECVCFVRDEVKNCSSPNCPLYPFRTGDAHSVSQERRTEMSEAKKESMKA